MTGYEIGIIVSFSFWIGFGCALWIYRSRPITNRMHINNRGAKIGKQIHIKNASSKDINAI